MTTDPSAEDFVVRIAVAGQGLEIRLLLLKLLSLLGIELLNDLLDERLISCNGGKLKAAPTIESLA